MITLIFDMVELTTCLGSVAPLYDLNLTICQTKAYASTEEIIRDFFLHLRFYYYLFICRSNDYLPKHHLLFVVSSIKKSVLDS